MSRLLLKRLAVVTVAVMSLGIMESKAGVLFSDGFESGDFSHKENGFLWGASNTGGSPASVAVVATKQKQGSNSMLMRFAGTGTANSWTEKRVSFTSARQTDLWVKFDLFVPTNLSVKDNGGGANNKFMAFYNGEYSTNFQVNFSYDVPNSSTSLGDLAVHLFQNGHEISNDAYGSTHAATLFKSADLGKWIEIIMHVKCTSASGVADGAMELWKNGEKIYSYKNLPIWGVAGYNYIDGVYILGWANTGFPSTTDFYLDDIVFSNTQINPASAATVSPPLAPTIQVDVVQ
jgi:hypothetical protein